MTKEIDVHEFPQAVCTDDQPHDQHLIAGTWREHCPGRMAPDQPSAFDPAQVLIERHRMSVTQGEVSVTYRGRLLGRFGDELRICPRGNGEHVHDDGPVCFGGWHGHNDQHWIDAARWSVAG